MKDEFYNLPTIEEKIAYLKKNGLELPDIEKFNSQWDEQKHRIMTDLVAYPNRTVEYSYTDELGKEQKGSRIELLNRVPLAYQKKIVSIAVTFLYGNPVRWTNNSEETDFYDSFLAVLDKEKIVFTDRTIATNNGRFTQCAELWWIEQEDNDYYGFNSKYRIKVNILSPEKNKMYPYFNEQGDMIAFLREYERSIDGDKVKYYEIYTAENIAILRETKAGIEVVEQKPNLIGKIPIVWYQFDNVEWSAVQPAIERKEEIASDIGEVNKKFSSPILGLHGEVTGSFSADKSGKVLQFNGSDSKAEFIQPPNASESLKNEDDKLEQIIHEMTNTINITPESLAGLGNMLATEQADYLFMSPHLKVTEKMSVYIPALKRRSSIVQSFLQLINLSFRSKKLSVEPVITPYIINNDAAFYKMLMEINGGLPLESQRSTMEKAGIKDVDKEMEQMAKEAEMKASKDVVF